MDGETEAQEKQLIWDLLADVGRAGTSVLALTALTVRQGKQPQGSLLPARGVPEAAWETMGHGG